MPPEKKLPRSREYFKRLWKRFCAEATRDNLAKRVFKCALATTITVIIILIPNIRDVYGRAGYLAPMTSVFVFGHPGRRLGGMAEALTLATVGSSLGVAWSSLGMYLSSLAHASNPSAAQGIKAVFLVIATFVHGYVRISTPRLFLLVQLLIVSVIIGLCSTATSLTSIFPAQFFYPILTAVAVVLLVNTTVFPEFGSTHLCIITIETLQKAENVQRAAAELFVAYAYRGDVEECIMKLKSLSTAKDELRAKVTACNAVYGECSFELAFSVLGPQELKPISGKGVKHLVEKTLNLVGACESTYALLGVDTEDASEEAKRVDLAVLKHRHETLGDQRLLEYLLKRVEDPLKQLQSAMARALDIVSACVAYVYDAHDMSVLGQPTIRTPSPAGILTQELDIYIDWLSAAIHRFGESSIDALEGAAALKGIGESSNTDYDVMPRDEVFVVSSFVMNLRHGASHTLDMLKHCKVLLQLRKDRNDRKSFHFPIIKLNKWLFSGGEEPEAVRPTERGNFQREQHEEEVERLHDVERAHTWKRKYPMVRKSSLSSGWMKFRRKFGRVLDWIANSDSFVYALKFTIGLMLVAWPAFVPRWNTWYNLARGVWAPLIFILVFENAVGSTIWIFALRAIGTVIGSTWGFAAYEARGGNEFVLAVMIMLATIPFYYVQLGTQYQKAGMVCTISMCVVSLSTHLQTVPGTSHENFYKRVVTMLIGGTVATLVQLVLFPVKARAHLGESLASGIVQIIRMESYLAIGADEHRNFSTSPALLKQFERASKKASASLASAETFLSFTKHEPRLKGGFDNQAVIYKEIIFVLRQIVSRMENMVQLRRAYGSGVLEQHNLAILPHRRNLNAAVTLTLYMVHEALTTKLPLPQFLPSARLADQRMVLRVRQILSTTAPAPAPDDIEQQPCTTTAATAAAAARRTLRLKFMSWNAGSAAREECIDYLEDLIVLAKALVGANEFRSGILERPHYREYAEEVAQGRTVQRRPRGAGETATASASGFSGFSSIVGRRKSVAIGSGAEEGGIPESLTRIQSRRIERRRTIGMVEP